VEDSSKNAAWLGATAFLFLFAGLYKGLLTSPVDLTFLALAACGVAVWIARPNLSPTLQPLTILLVLLGAWLTFRVLPNIDGFGLRKAAEFWAFGPPAFVLGVIGASYPRILNLWAKWLSWSAVPASAWLCWQAIGAPDYFAEIGSGGYQLTGLYLATAMIASAYQRKPLLLAIAVLGSAVTGSLSGFFFGCAGVLLVWLMQKDWRGAAVSVLACLLVLSAFSVTVSPPLIVSRVVGKTVGLMLVAAGRNEETVILNGVEVVKKVAPEEAMRDLGWGGEISEAVASGALGAAGTEPVDVNSGDRAVLFASALEKYAECPVLGCGYGSEGYAGERYPHNAFLELLAEAGPIALVLLLSIFCLAMAGAVKAGNAFVAGVLLLFLLTSMFNGYWGGRLILFSIGMAAGAMHYAGVRWATLPAPLLGLWRRVSA
jgi:hypothetical protein